MSLSDVCATVGVRMGLFRKSAPDQDWLRDAEPLYDAARAWAAALSASVRRESLEDQVQSVKDVLQRFPVLRDRVRGLPNPTSTNARRARKNLELALNEYVEGARRGAELLRELAGLLGERLTSRELSDRAAAGELDFKKMMFEETVKKAEARMEEVATFFSKDQV